MGEEYRKLTREELEALAGEPLPERAAMSLVNANIAIAEATQTAPIDQGSEPWSRRTER